MTITKKLTSAAAITAFAASGAAGIANADSASAAETRWCQVKVTASALKIRKGPGTSYTAIKQVPRGTKAYASFPSKNGFRQFKGGWASAKYLQRTTSGGCPIA